MTNATNVHAASTEVAISFSLFTRRVSNAWIIGVTNLNGPTNAHKHVRARLTCTGKAGRKDKVSDVTRHLSNSLTTQHVHVILLLILSETRRTMSPVYV